MVKNMVGLARFEHATHRFRSQGLTSTGLMSLLLYQAEL